MSQSTSIKVVLLASVLLFSPAAKTQDQTIRRFIVMNNNSEPILTCEKDDLSDCAPTEGHTWPEAMRIMLTIYQQQMADQSKRCQEDEKRILDEWERSNRATLKALKGK